MLRQLFAVFFLVAYVGSGQLSACVCEIAPVSRACASHDHSQEGPAHKNSCQCPTCHTSCSHEIFTAVQFVLPSLPHFARVRPPLADPRGIPLIPREIFIPPKVA